jgi:hypothetical protein
VECHNNYQERFGTAKIFNGQNRCGEIVTGDKIKIHYMFDQPLYTKVTDERFLPPAWFVGGVSLIAVIGFAFVSLIVVALIKTGLQSLAAHGKHERLLLEGVVIDGELVEANADEVKDVYVVRVKYRAKLPDGKGVVREQKLCRNDLRNQPLPSPGTPVAILYAGHECYVML